jgi:hypothetical protein
VEIKNWGDVESKQGVKYLLQPKFIQQFKYYLQKISSMNEIAYVFKNRGAVTTQKVKAQFQEIFRGTVKTDNEGNVIYGYEIFVEFWNNQALRNSLFPTITGSTSQDEKDAKLLFIAMVNLLNNSIYNFVVVK